MTKNEIINHLVSMLPISLESKLSINDSILSDANWASRNCEYDKKCRRELIDENKVIKEILKTINRKATLQPEIR